jgi:hypothetical protein
MSTTYYCLATDSDLSAGGEFNKGTSLSAPGASSFDGVYAQGGVAEPGYFFSPPANPSDDGGTGARNFTLTVDLSLADADTFVDAEIARVNSSGTVQTGPISADGSEQASTGEPLTFSWTSADLGTFATDDRLRVTLIGRNSAAHGGDATLTYVVGSAGVRIVAPWDLPPQFSDASMADADRNFDTPYQDIVVNFSDSVRKDGGSAYNVGDTIPGLTVKVNGGSATAVTYRSGDATSQWKVRLAELVQQDDSVTISYDQTTGVLENSLDVELKALTDGAIANNLTKRVRFALKKADNSAAASETVKLGVFTFDSGTVANANWMTREMKSTPTTDGSGLVDVEYTGAGAVGATIYVVVIRPDTSPTQSLIWTITVQ